MFAYESLARCPGAFRSLTGMTPAEFETLLTAFGEAQDRLRRGPAPRAAASRAAVPPGPATPTATTTATASSWSPVWLRIYPTYELLGFFFGLHKGNAQLNVRDALAALDTIDDFPFDRPGRDRKKLRSAAEVMAAFPQVRVIIDGKEQRVNRPTGYEAQEPYYSGKKKATRSRRRWWWTRAGGSRRSASRFAGANHDLPLLCGSGVLEQLAPGEAAMVDKGYVGLANYFPDVPAVIPFKASRGHPLTEEQEAYNREVALHRIVVEHPMVQLNRFTVLRQVFRGRQRSRHGRVIRVVAKLVNRRLRVKPLKTYAA